MLIYQALEEKKRTLLNGFNFAILAAGKVSALNLMTTFAVSVFLCQGEASHIAELIHQGAFQADSQLRVSESLPNRSHYQPFSKLFGLLLIHFEFCSN